MQLSSRILAIVLSPWLIMLVSTLLFGVLYFCYFRPRLFFPYPKYPSELHWKRPYTCRRRFRADPLGELEKARASVCGSVLWTDMTDPSPLTITLGDDVHLRSFFSHSQETLSWDYALEHVWPGVFNTRSSFYSNVCLCAAFSPLRMHYYTRGIKDNIERAMTNIDGDILRWLDQLVLRILASVVFGEEEAKLSALIQAINKVSLNISGSQKKLRKSKAQFDTLVSAILSGGIEQPSSGEKLDSYILFLASQQVNIKDISNHLLVILLQSRLIVLNLSLWHLLDPATPIHILQRSKSPLFLLKKALQHTLLSKTLVPKDSLVAVSPAYEHSTKRTLSSTTLSTASTTPMGSRDQLLPTCNETPNQLVLRRYPMEHLFSEIVRILGEAITLKYDVFTNGTGVKYADARGLFLAWPENPVFIKQKGVLV